MRTGTVIKLFLKPGMCCLLAGMSDATSWWQISSQRATVCGCGCVCVCVGGCECVVCVCVVALSMSSTKWEGGC